MARPVQTVIAGDHRLTIQIGRGCLTEEPPITPCEHISGSPSDLLRWEAAEVSAAGITCETPYEMEAESQQRRDELVNSACKRIQKMVRGATVRRTLRNILILEDDVLIKPRPADEAKLLLEPPEQQAKSSRSRGVSGASRPGSAAGSQAGSDRSRRSLRISSRSEGASSEEKPGVTYDVIAERFHRTDKFPPRPERPPPPQPEYDEHGDLIPPPLVDEEPLPPSAAELAAISIFRMLGVEDEEDGRPGKLQEGHWQRIYQHHRSRVHKASLGGSLPPRLLLEADFWWQMLWPVDLASPAGNCEAKDVDKEAAALAELEAQNKGELQSQQQQQSMTAKVRNQASPQRKKAVKAPEANVLQSLGGRPVPPSMPTPPVGEQVPLQAGESAQAECKAAVKAAKQAPVRVSEAAEKTIEAAKEAQAADAASAEAKEAMGAEWKVAVEDAEAASTEMKNEFQQVHSLEEWHKKALEDEEKRASDEEKKLQDSLEKLSSQVKENQETTAQLQVKVKEAEDEAKKAEEATAAASSKLEAEMRAAGQDLEKDVKDLQSKQEEAVKALKDEIARLEESTKASSEEAWKKSAELREKSDKEQTEQSSQLESLKTQLQATAADKDLKSKLENLQDRRVKLAGASIEALEKGLKSVKEVQEAHAKTIHKVIKRVFIVSAAVAAIAAVLIFESNSWPRWHYEGKDVVGYQASLSGMEVCGAMHCPMGGKCCGSEEGLCCNSGATCCSTGNNSACCSSNAMCRDAQSEGNIAAENELASERPATAAALQDQTAWSSAEREQAVAQAQEQLKQQTQIEAFIKGFKKSYWPTLLVLIAPEVVPKLR